MLGYSMAHRTSLIEPLMHINELRICELFMQEHYLPSTVEAAAQTEWNHADAFRAASERLGVTGRQVGVVNGFNYSQGDPVRLTVYAPPPRNGNGNGNAAAGAE